MSQFSTNKQSQPFSESRPIYDYLMKVIIIGDSSVGKTCLLLRFVDDIFSVSHMPTIGIDFKLKMMDVGNKRVKL